MKKLLLHACCAPCLSSVIERIKTETDYDVVVYFSNSNILPQAEYEKRKDALCDFMRKVHPNTLVVYDEYVPQEFFEAIKGRESLGEGSIRCDSCIAYRLTKTVKYAKENGFDLFATTLSVSPHKNAQKINEIGNALAKEFGVDYLESDFKKRDGYLRSIKLSKEYNIYRYYTMQNTINIKI